MTMTSTSTTWWSLGALDTWFFRDGAAFDKGTPWQSAVASVFPPSPRVLSGALRAALCRASGWTGGGWTDEQNRRFGDWPDTPGELSLTGPLLALRGRLLFPAPAHLLVRKDASSEGAKEGTAKYVAVDFLRPSREPIACDLGRVKVPVASTSSTAGSGEEAKSAHDLWIDTAGLERVLSGQLPESGSFVGSDQLYDFEPRVGLEMTNRDLEKERTSGDVKLYSPLHVRPRSGVALSVGLHGVDGVDPASPMTLGGEGRMAEVSESSTAPKLAPAKLPADGAFALLQLTPALWPDDQLPAPGSPLGGQDSIQLVTAVADRPYGVGGWNGRKLEPLPLRPATPAGSVWFCEGQAPTPDADGFVRLGDDTAHGFGLFALAQLPTSNS